MPSCQYTVLTGERSFYQEANSPEGAIELFIQRIKARGEQTASKIPHDSTISLSLYAALLTKTLKLVVIAKTERPRKILGGFQNDHYVEPVTLELAEFVRRLLTDEEFRSVHR